MVHQAGNSGCPPPATWTLLVLRLTDHSPWYVAADGTFASFVACTHMSLQGLGVNKGAHAPRAGITAADHLQPALLRCLFSMCCNKMNAQALLIGKGPFTGAASDLSGFTKRLLHAPRLSVGANFQNCSKGAAHKGIVHGKFTDVDVRKR